MVVLGIISEYNPFHNGHLYHLKKSIETAKADAVITVMSGNFTQRGEPTLFDKWVRTEAAVKNGVNLVIELPVCFSTSSAELFAFGAVSLLERLGIVDYISFGSEAGNINDLVKISEILANEDDLFKTNLKIFLKEGNSFARAREFALKKLNTKGDVLECSNNILGIEYLKWLIRLNSKMKPITIKRIGSEYNRQDLNDQIFISSATSIRNTLAHDGLSAIKNHLPTGSLLTIEEKMSKGINPIFKTDMDKLIFYELLKNDNLEEIFDVSEGLNKRIKNMLFKSTTLKDLLFNIKTKRYALSRISRILLHTVLNYTKEDANLFNKSGPLYVRILGFDDVGRDLIKSISKNCDLRMITNLNKQYRYFSDTAKNMLDKDILATNIYSLLGSNGNIKLGMDFTNRPVIINR